MARPARRPLAGVLVAVALLPLLVLTARPARADSADAADARARQLVARVQDLQKQVEAALAGYDSALGGLAGAVNSNVAADIALGDASQTAGAVDQLAGARVRAIYRSGGPFALYATVLEGDDPGDLLSRIEVVQRVVADDAATSRAEHRAVLSARGRAVAARAFANDRAQAAKRVGDSADHVRQLLAQMQSLLSEARANATRLRAEESALTAAQASYAGITADRIANIRPIAVPPEYMELYHRAAATCTGLSWTVLAAIGQVESGHGRNTIVSSAGAMGPMQFMPPTFAHYAVDGDGDGDVDILDPADSIFTAAAYLCANGAGAGGSHLANALWHYNHADWYVQMVLTLARRYG